MYRSLNALIAVWVAIASALGIAVPVADAAPPPTPALSDKTASLVRTMKGTLEDFRLQLVLFDHDRRQDDRTVDLTVTGDEDANAEGLMTRAQALRILDALAVDGFFDRAVEPDPVRWNPPPQPYYYVWARFDGGHGVSEFRGVDVSMTNLLVHVRDALAKGRAARAVDRAVAAQDPQRRRWQPATQPSPRPAEPALPPGASPLHPGYSFRRIEKGWEVREGLLRPAHGRFVSRLFPEPDEPADEYKTLFRELNYTSGPNGRPCKSVILYPSGHVFREADSYEYGVDFPQGDAYERILSKDGALLYYSHVKDGKVVDALSILPHARTDRVVHGRGLVRQPTYEPDAYDDIWYYQGMALVDRRVEEGRASQAVLRDNTELGHAAALSILADRSETLIDDGHEWHREAGGAVSRRALYRRDEPEDETVPGATRQTALANQYAAARRRFTTRFAVRAQAAGFSLDEMGVRDVANAPAASQPER